MNASPDNILYGAIRSNSTTFGIIFTYDLANNQFIGHDIATNDYVVALSWLKDQEVFA